LESRKSRRVEGHKDDLFEIWMPGEDLGGFIQSDAAGGLEGETVDSGTNGGKGKGTDSVLERELEDPAVTGRKGGMFAMGAIVPDGADGVNDKAGGQVVAAGDFCIAGGATVKRPAFFQQGGAGSPMYGAIDAASAEQGGVGGVNDRIGFATGDIALNNFDPVHGIPVIASGCRSGTLNKTYTISG